MPAKTNESTARLPFRTKKFRNLKDALRHAVYSRPGGKTAETIAFEAGLDRLSDLSRYISDNDNDQRGKVLDIFIPLLIALEENGVEIADYISGEVRAARQRVEDEERDETVRFVKRLIEMCPDLPKAISQISKEKK